MTHWTFEDGRLVARDEAGALLWAWLAEDAIGRPLAALLNQAPALSLAILPPLGARFRLTNAEGLRAFCPCQHTSMRICLRIVFLAC